MISGMMLTTEAMIAAFSFSIFHSPLSIVLLGGMGMGM